MVKIVHGKYGTRANKTWNSMRERCLNPNASGYKSYGGRGISVCARWSEFINFHADIGDPPTAKHSLDRINVNGNYEPGNCRWATTKEQNNNRRDNRLVDFRGRTQTLTQWSEEFGLGLTTVRARLNNGWSPDEAFTIPSTGQTPKRRETISRRAQVLAELGEAPQGEALLSKSERAALNSCSYGHVMTDDNVYLRRERGRVSRICRLCARRRTHAQRQRRRVA